MGAKPSIQLSPYILTDNTRGPKPLRRRNSDHSKAAIWIYIYSNLKQWARRGKHFDLSIISDMPYSGNGLPMMKIENPKYYAIVTNVKKINDYKIMVHIKVRSRWFKKKLGYRYGGAINYLDSRSNF